MTQSKENLKIKVWKLDFTLSKQVLAIISYQITIVTEISGDSIVLKAFFLDFNESNTS